MTVTSRQVEKFRRVVLAAPVSYSVYSVFSFYGSRRGNELAGTWLVAALTSLGHEVAAIRQTLYRMESSEVLRSRVVGRNKFYQLSPGARAEAEAGLAKIMEPAGGNWDGQWTIVQLSAEGEARDGKELVRELMRAEGFARVGPNLFVHPRDRTARLLRAARGHDVAEMLTIFRGARVAPTGDLAYATSSWNLDDIAAGYRQFVKRYTPLDDRARSLADADAFIVRFALVFDYLETAWRDPDLPRELLPIDWPGATARKMAQSLYRRFLPAALAFGDQLSGPAAPAL